jgi:hypothetical protein
MSRAVRHALIPLLFVAAAASAQEACRADSGPGVLPLVELYTAEGCNDCPPADRWMTTLSQQTAPGQAAMLAFHVDYWDEAGWPDRFADHAYGQRQALRIGLARKKVPYTPQVMIGKDVMVKWSNSARVRSILEQARSQQAAVALGMRLDRQGEALKISVDAKRVQATEPALVWLALYQDGLTSQISDGENKGLTLHHDRVVRALAGPWRMDDKTLADEVEMRLPAQSDAGKMGLVLFAESGKTGEGLQALALPLGVCSQAR